MLLFPLLRYRGLVSLVEVFLDSNELNQTIAWYIHKYGRSDVKPTKFEVVLLHKLETMRDAMQAEEEAFKSLTK